MTEKVSTATDIDETLLILKEGLEEAEAKAWDSLSRYKFQMFGYWAAIWVHLNRIGGFKKPNPWKCLVDAARGREGGLNTKTCFDK